MNDNKREMDHLGDELTRFKIISSLLWKLLERSGTQGIQFIVMIVLARQLLPEDFGLIVLVAIFISLANVLVQSGFNTALIQKKNADEIDFSSVFYLNVFVTSILYIGLFFSAPILASFFEQEQLILVLRTLSITLFLGSINSIQHVVIARNLQFKKLFFSSLGAVIVAGVVAVVMAYANFGVWALVGYQLINQFLIILILWFTVKWRPQLLFSLERIKELFSFGWKILIASLIDTFNTNLQSLMIGKMFSPALLGFYNRGEQFPSLVVSNVNGSIQSVLFPTLSSQQENKKRMKEMIKRSIGISSFMIFPMMVGLAIIAEPLVKLLLTEKWLPVVPFIQIFCASYALWPIHTSNLQAINALGRSDIFVKLEIIKSTVSLVVLVVCLQFGVHAVALGVLISGVISTFINAYPNAKLLDYHMKEQCMDILPSLLISIVMGGVVNSVHWLDMTDMLTISIQLFLGIIVYIGLAIVFKIESFTYLLFTIKDLLRSKKGKDFTLKETLE